MYTMRPAEFAYHRPTSLDEAISLLGDDSRPIAGGHSLLPIMKLRLRDAGRARRHRRACPGSTGSRRRTAASRSVRSPPTRRSQARR